MQTQTTRTTGDGPTDLHLRIAIKNGVILITLSFVMGVAAGWAVMHWRSAPIGAVLGALIAAGFFLWFSRMWLVTRGLLHHTGLGREGS